MHPKWFERITVWVFSTQSQSTRGNISIPSKPQATNNVNSNSMWADFCGLLQTAEFFYFSLIRNCVIEHMTTQITSVGSRSWIKPNCETDSFNSKFFQYTFQTVFRHIVHTLLTTAMGGRKYRCYYSHLTHEESQTSSKVSHSSSRVFTPSQNFQSNNTPLILFGTFPFFFLSLI